MSEFNIDHYSIDRLLQLIQKDNPTISLEQITTVWEAF